MGGGRLEAGPVVRLSAPRSPGSRGWRRPPAAQAGCQVTAPPSKGLPLPVTVSLLMPLRPEPRGWDMTTQKGH